MDFTLSAYMQCVSAAQKAGYRIGAIIDHFEQPDAEGPVLLIRHDVDRRPQNALDMARAEAELGVRSTYYFRIVPSAWDPAVIAAIRDLGHEVGYHYEDWYLAKYDAARAIDMFKQHLARIREIAPVRTIAMHGSPFARENNMTIWDHFDYREHGLEDCILSADWSQFVFFTDTGRTYAPSGANLRDYLGDAKTADGVRKSSDLANYLAERKAEKVQLSVHPERWTDKPAIWADQYARDFAANSVKRVLKLLRR